jgi:hypothetical protein
MHSRFKRLPIATFVALIINEYKLLKEERKKGV